MISRNPSGGALEVLLTLSNVRGVAQSSLGNALPVALQYEARKIESKI